MKIAALESLKDQYNVCESPYKNHNYIHLHKIQETRIFINLI